MPLIRPDWWRELLLLQLRLLFMKNIFACTQQVWVGTPLTSSPSNRDLLNHPACSNGSLGEKMGGRPLLIWLPMLGCPLVGSYLRWWFNGTPYVFTIMVVGSTWWSLFGCVATAANGALMMDCLPADERGEFCARMTGPSLPCGWPSDHWQRAVHEPLQRPAPTPGW